VEVNDGRRIDKENHLFINFSDEPITPDPDSSESCPMTAWEDWPCEGVCENGTLTGMRLRYRYHIVDGTVIGKYSVSKNILGENINRNKYAYY
jgi:hypothetical protein